MSLSNNATLSLQSKVEGRDGFRPSTISDEATRTSKEVKGQALLYPMMGGPDGLGI